MCRMLMRPGVSAGRLSAGGAYEGKTCKPCACAAGRVNGKALSEAAHVKATSPWTTRSWRRACQQESLERSNAHGEQSTQVQQMLLDPTELFVRLGGACKP